MKALNGRDAASGKRRRSCVVMSGRWDEHDGEADARCEMRIAQLGNGCDGS